MRRRDDYGRELVNVLRQRTDGSSEDLGAALVATGLVRSYAYGPREPWC